MSAMRHIKLACRTPWVAITVDYSNGYLYSVV